MNDPRYPIGKFERPTTVDEATRARHVADLAAAPALLRASVHGLDDAQLDTPYREGGWSVRQVVHHVADSQVQAYVRTKLALTEHEPTIKTWDERLWAELADVKGPLEPSLRMLEGAHARWVACLRSLPAEAFGRRIVHPVSGLLTIDQLLALYSWHSRHHTAHVTVLRTARGW